MLARKSFVAFAVLTWMGSRAAVLPAAENRYFDSNGVKIRYIVEGEGEPVLLIHGFAANLHWQWVTPGVVKTLAKHYRVIAFDNRGHGLSGAPHEPDRYGVEMVEDAVRLLDHLEIERAHVVGYSMGAFIAAKLLALHPERVMTATLGGAGWARENDERRQFVQELAESLDRGDGIGPLLVRLTPEGRPKPRAWWLKLINFFFRLLNDQQALAAAARGMHDLIVPEDALRANRAPALVVIGEVDPLRSTVDELEPVMSNLEVVVIDGADHMQTFFRPEFQKSIEEFLLAHSKRPAAK
ncbi:MAG TPA: alpha/beta hydrolase [Pirellulales bacterium]|nr:alpha/beta hydrolase [Pirellulales bacterium]